MAIGDRSDAGVVLYNESGAPLTATVRAWVVGRRAENAELTVALQRVDPRIWWCRWWLAPACVGALLVGSQRWRRRVPRRD